MKKSRKADLESKRKLFLQAGLLTSLAFTFIAFEWKTPEEKISIKSSVPIEDITWILPPITLPPASEAPKPLAPLKPSPVFELVPDDKEFEEKEGEEIPSMDTIIIAPFVPPVEVIKEPDFYIIADTMPSFPGGEAALFSWLNKELKYPHIPLKNGIEGTVYLSFIIDKEGMIKNLEVKRGVRGLDEEALRVVRAMPRWNPGKQRGKPVNVQYSLPIRFELRN